MHASCIFHIVCHCQSVRKFFVVIVCLHPSSFMCVSSLAYRCTPCSGHVFCGRVVKKVNLFMPFIPVVLCQWIYSIRNVSTLHIMLVTVCVCVGILSLIPYIKRGGEMRVMDALKCSTENYAEWALLFQLACSTNSFFFFSQVFMEMMIYIMDCWRYSRPVVKSTISFRWCEIRHTNWNTH